jgi:hypothetical protein
MQIASVIVGIAALYAIAGALVAAAFLAGGGIDRLDPAAKHAYYFRALIFPGVVLLWPIVLLRWARARPAGPS